MKRIKIFLYIFILIPVLIISAVSCSDDIYYKISVELPLIQPRIKGSPTNFVVFNGKMYVATGKSLYVYNGSEEEWTWTKKPFSENIAQLAVTDSRIYAFCYEDREKDVYRKIKWSETGETGEWKEDLPEISGDFNVIQSIYSANDKLYIGAKKKDANEYAVHVYFFDASDGYKIDTIFSGVGPAFLNGVEYDGTTTYISTLNGIFADREKLKPGKPGERIFKKIESDVSNFVGIIMLPDGTITAINRSGALYKIEIFDQEIFICSSADCENEDDLGSEETVCPKCGEPVKKENVKNKRTKEITKLPNDRWASGAIALWKDRKNPSNQLLLIGRRDREYTTTTGYTYGYMELELDNAGSIIETAAFKEPGIGNVTTVDDNSRYASSLGTVPINHLFQSPEGILFAATHQSGVWSYRFRDNENVWNAEE